VFINIDESHPASAPNTIQVIIPINVPPESKLIIKISNPNLPAQILSFLSIISSGKYAISASSINFVKVLSSTMAAALACLIIEGLRNKVSRCRVVSVILHMVHLVVVVVKKNIYNYVYNYIVKHVTTILVIVIILLAALVGYFAGRTNQPIKPLPSPVSPSPSTETIVACTMEAKICPDGSSVGRSGPKCEFAPCPELKTQKVTGGGIMSFPRYELTVPANWSVKREIPGPDSERLVLSSGELGITILQGGFGGSVCLFTGDADSEGPSARYTSFVEIVNLSGDKFRRAKPASGNGFGVCQLTQYGWGAPTLYGAISLKTPSSPSASDLSIIDEILSSLTKI
jgi:hypothetical protein